MTAKAKGPVVPHEFLSIDEAASLLRVGRAALYAAVQRNELPGVVKIGKHLRVRRSALMGTVNE